MTLRSHALLVLSVLFILFNNRFHNTKTAMYHLSEIQILKFQSRTSRATLSKSGLDRPHLSALDMSMFLYKLSLNLAMNLHGQMMSSDDLIPFLDSVPTGSLNLK